MTHFGDPSYSNLGVLRSLLLQLWVQKGTQSDEKRVIIVGNDDDTFWGPAILQFERPVIPLVTFLGTKRNPNVAQKCVAITGHDDDTINGPLILQFGRPSILLVAALGTTKRESKVNQKTCHHRGQRR